MKSFSKYLLATFLIFGSIGVSGAILTDQPTLAVPALTDILHVVDVSDTTSDPAGTSKQATLADLGKPFTSQKTILINVLTDFPAPAGGVITLAAETEYLIGNDVNLAANRLVLGSNTAVKGTESIVVTLTYTGTGDMFTILNTRNRISNLSVSATTGRCLNFSDNTDSIFRMNDVTLTCATVGLFNSSGTNGSTVRFTNVSPASITTDGITITGDWNTWLWEVSALNISAGTMFDFGTATFDAIVLDVILADLGAGTTLISGLTSSGNINAGGLGIVTRMLTSGAGTVLAGIVVDDFRWIFTVNDDIQRTQPDAMVSLNSNATETVISVAGTKVKAAGTWVAERGSFFTVDTTGRITYIGERPLTTPVDIVGTIASASGTNKAIEICLALNASVIANSCKTNLVGQNDPKSTSVLWQLTLVQNDFLEVFISNETDTVNLVMSDGIQRAR